MENSILTRALDFLNNMTPENSQQQKFNEALINAAIKGDVDYFEELVNYICSFYFKRGQYNDMAPYDYLVSLFNTVEI